MSTALFFFGLILLWPGSELVLRSSLSLAKRLRLSPAFVGLTVLAVGTNIPELAITISALTEGSLNPAVADLVVGNVIGTTIGQLSILLGLIGLFHVLDWKKSQILKQGMMLIGGSLLLGWFLLDSFISPLEGLILVAIYSCYMFYLFLNRHQDFLPKKYHSKQHILVTLLMLGAGLTVVGAGSNLVIGQGSQVAELIGINEALVGLILIGLGTSLPELAVSLWALFRKEMDLSVGNIIGSSIFDIFFLLGGTALMTGWRVTSEVFNWDLLILIALSVIVTAFFLTREKLERHESLLLILFYMAYFGIRFWVT